MVIQYKCPNCGSTMSYDPTSGTLACDSCGRQDSIESYQNEGGDKDYEFNSQEAANDVSENLGDYEEVRDETVSRDYAEGEAVEYHCDNCGATLVTEPNTTATMCSFCNSPMILADRMAGKLSPAKVIPFSITKEGAIEAFRKWSRKGLLLPKDFVKSERLKNLMGTYIPFWLYDVNGRGELNAICTKVRSYESGDYIYTETHYYHVYRKASLNYDDIPVDASKKMDDRMMDKLEPFHYGAMKEFSAAYLAGYLAESYDYSDEEMFARAKARTADYVEKYLRSTIQGYASVTVNDKHIDVLRKRADYALLPVWLFSFDYKDAEHNFIMNAQTGKVVGKPPLSKQRMAAWFGGVAAASFVLLRVISLLTGGPIL